MKSIAIFMFVVVTLGLSGIASGAVLLDETFDGTVIDANWNVLDTNSDGGTTVVELDGSGQLSISLTNSARFYNQGVGSKVAYAVPAGEMLVVDFYGDNILGHTYTFPAVSTQESSGFFDTGLGAYAAFKGADSYYGDWAQCTGISYADLAGPNLPSQHSILTIDANNIHWYIETDFWENLVSPTPLYTRRTSYVFSAGELDAGLYINLCAAKYTEWFVGESNETFDGVRVSTDAATPIDPNALGVLLDETFHDSNLIDWTKLDTTSAGTVRLDIDSTYGSLNIVGMADNASLRYQGLMSNDTFSVSAGNTLVVDFYGVNQYGQFWSGDGPYNSQNSLQFYLVSANDYSGSGYVSGDAQNAVGIRGRDHNNEGYAVDDCAYSNGTGSGAYTRIGIDTLRYPPTTKHLIVTIDASETKLYIEDDYYENVVAGPNELELLQTFATSDMFSPAQLASGLHVYVLAAKHFYDIPVGESFSGVKVSRILTPVPASCAEVISMGGGLAGDVNSDCAVDFKDLSELVQLWLYCVDPQDALCSSPWI